MSNEQIVEHQEPKHNRSDLLQGSHRELVQPSIAEHGVHAFHGAAAMFVMACAPSISRRMHQAMTAAGGASGGL